MSVWRVTAPFALRHALNTVKRVFYNYYLRSQYNLGVAESFFEVPVDSAVARGLRRECPRGTFPAWPGLKRLGQAEHAEYQCHAAELANRTGLARVHLDAVLWVQER